MNIDRFSRVSLVEDFNDKDSVLSIKDAISIILQSLSLVGIDDDGDRIDLQGRLTKPESPDVDIFLFLFGRNKHEFLRVTFYIRGRSSENEQATKRV